MNQFRRAITNPFPWMLLLSVAYFVIRLFHLTSLPIFTDEAIYIRWSQIGGNDASWRFISLTDGKQPLFTWFVMISLRVIRDPLFAGRFVSVIAGYLSMIGMYLLTYELFRDKRMGIIACFLYCISPFTVMYDRLALYDALVATFSIWNLYLAILLVRYIRLDVALFSGLFLGAGILNKTSAFLSIYFMPTTLILFDWKKYKRLYRIALWTGLFIIAFILSQIVYAVLRLSPFFYIVSQKDALFIYPVREWLKHPLEFFRGNLRGMFDWYITYMTWPVFIAALLSFVVKKTKNLEKILLTGWWILPFCALALFGRILYPRFILFMAMPILPLASYTTVILWERIVSKTIKIFIIALIIGPSIILSRAILSDITHASIAKGDIGQYVNDWPSGWGVPEVSVFLKNQSKSGPIAVYTEGTFGLLPYALEVYLIGNKNIEIHGIWPLPQKFPDDIRMMAVKKPTFFIANQTQTKPDWPVKLISSYQKGSNIQSFMRLYQVVLPEGK